MQICVRKDLIATPRDRGVESEWVVKDPVSFTHFLFSREELFLLNLFDGQRSLDEIRKLWQAEFQTRSLTEAQLKATVMRFVRDKLVKVDKFGLGHRLHADEETSKRAQLLMKMSSPLVFKMGGIDPGEILDLLWLPGQILFSRAVVIFNLLFSFFVFVYLLGHFEEIASRAGTMANFFSAKNMLLMMGLIAIVKVIHELGHAVACRKYGGECFEIGVMLLAFFPTLYCDVTDSWMFREKWKRIMVAFAGIYVEILLATLCAVFWLLTGPGLANSIFFNVAVMCSVNTLFINGNPLLKYDGYYIFSDLVDRPNLQKQGQNNFRQFVDRFWYQPARDSPTNVWLATFGGLSALYRWFVIIAIIGGVYTLLKACDFGHVADGIALVLASLTGYRIFKQKRMERVSMGPRRVNLPRTFATLMGIAFLVLLAFFLPLPTSVLCNVNVESDGSSIVYATSDGQLELNLAPYEQVSVNDCVGTITNKKLEETRFEAQARIEHLVERSDRLRRQLDKGFDAASELQLVKNEIVQVRKSLKSLDEEIEALSLKSDTSGTIRPVTIESTSDLEQGEFNFFDTAFRGCLVKRGQPLFSIEGNQKRLVSYLAEKDVEFLGPGQPVQVVFNQNVRQAFDATVEEIIEIDVNLNPEETERSGLETYVDQTGATRTLQTPYRVIIVTKEIPDSVRVGSTGRAKIAVPRTTMAQKTWFVLDRWWREQNY